jgi:hypothetical protein
MKFLKITQQTTGGCQFVDVKLVITKYFGLKFEGDSEGDSMVLKRYEVAMLQEQRRDGEKYAAPLFLWSSQCSNREGI